MSRQYYHRRYETRYYGRIPINSPLSGLQDRIGTHGMYSAYQVLVNCRDMRVRLEKEA